MLADRVVVRFFLRETDLHTFVLSLNKMLGVNFPPLLIRYIPYIRSPILKSLQYIASGVKNENSTIKIVFILVLHDWANSSAA